jgi:hypothetical protein
MNLKEFEKEYISRLKEIRTPREGEFANEYVRRCWREEVMLPIFPVDLLYSESWNMSFGE